MSFLFHDNIIVAEIFYLVSVSLNKEEKQQLERKKLLKRNCTDCFLLIEQFGSKSQQYMQTCMTCSFAFPRTQEEL